MSVILRAPTLFFAKQMNLRWIVVAISRRNIMSLTLLKKFPQQDFRLRRPVWFHWPTRQKRSTVFQSKRVRGYVISITKSFIQFLGMQQLMFDWPNIWLCQSRPHKDASPNKNSSHTIPIVWESVKKYGLFSLFSEYRAWWCQHWWTITKVLHA